MKHTKGEWIVDQDGLHYPTEITNGKYDSRLDAIIGGKQIAIVTKEYDEEEYDNDEVQANAKLIAAAPDMLERIERMKELVWVYFESMPQDIKHELSLLREVYKKATE